MDIYYPAKVISVILIYDEYQFNLTVVSKFKSNAREIWCVILVSVSGHILLKITLPLHFVLMPLILLHLSSVHECRSLLLHPSAELQGMARHRSCVFPQDQPVPDLLSLSSAVSLLQTYVYRKYCLPCTVICAPISSSYWFFKLFQIFLRCTAAL